MLPSRLTFVDIETTGASFHKDRIIEVGIIQTENGEVTQVFESLINPNQYVPPYILEMTGISPEELESAPTFYDLKQDIGELLADSVFVAHNVAFDYGFIKKEFDLLGASYSAKRLCTVQLSRALFPRYRSHNLDSLISRFAFKCENRHRALSDAQVLLDFVEVVKQQFSEEKIAKVINHLLKKPSVPVGISEQELNDLPETPGVYTFYGDNGIPLYVGKSINIRNRVLAHFSAATLSSTELKIAAQVKSIETICTQGELGALLKESELIKQMQPIYNRRLRNASKLVYLGSTINEEGYKVLYISQTQPAEILGVFKTQKQAKENLMTLCEQHNLCKKLLGLEKATHSCFGHQLGKCKGACVRKEKPVLYNLRFDLAFVKTKIGKWPFNSPLIISEGVDRFVVDNWRYKQLSEEDDGLEISNTQLFDIDTYKILERYIYAKKNQRNISTSIGQLQSFFAALE